MLIAKNIEQFNLRQVLDYSSHWRHFGMKIAFLIVGTALVFAVMIPWNMWQIWQVEHYPHSEATIVRVWTEKWRAKHKASDLVYGEIQFEMREGNSVETCVAKVRLGLPEDGLKAGDKIDVVPRGKDCKSPPLIPNIVLRSRGIS